MKRILVFGICLSSFTCGIKTSLAASQDECAIWLCLPGGFPNGCSVAYFAFKDRIKHGKSPLPDLSSCMSGPDGSKSNGRYDMGVEYYVPCKAGYELDQSKWNAFRQAVCVPTSNWCNVREKYRRQKVDCDPYNTEIREKPHYVKMWVDDQYLGKFFYR
jgi:hypothetical protein